MAIPDPYIVLGIDRTADEREIKARYQQLVRKVRSKIMTKNDTIFDSVILISSTQMPRPHKEQKPQKNFTD